MDIRDYLDYEPAGKRIEDLDTPVPLIDIGIAPGFRCEDHVPRIVLQYG